MSNKDLKEIYTAQEFAEAFGISKRTITRYQKRGILPVRKNPINNYRYFTRQDVIDFKNFIEGETNARKEQA